MRAPYQILAIPYRFKGDIVQFCIFHRSDSDIWQFVAGGGEEGEKIDSAKREVLKETGSVIGTIGLNEDADDNEKRRNVGVRIAEQYRNMGLMSEALTEVFANNKGKEFSWFCKVDDERSGHLAEKFGFEYIKTFPKVQRNEKEEPSDYYYYVLKL